MTIYLPYFCVIIIANTVGAISGMGGGVLIKPIFDVIGYHNLAEITFYSSVAVFVMSISSTVKQIKNGVTIKWKDTFSLALGSIFGGYFGQFLLNFFLSTFHSEEYVRDIQNLLMIASLLLVLASRKFNLRLNKEGKTLYFLVGLVLGGLSIFLGIGGGPINVALLLVLFPLSIQQTTVYSIICIFFSQLAKLGSLIASGEVFFFDLTLLWVIIPAAILGGFFGAVLSQKLEEKQVMLLFNIIVLCIIVMSATSLLQ